MPIPDTIKTGGKWGISSISYIKRHWSWILVILLLLPTIITSINYSIETKNWSYPLFQLSTRILTADAALNGDINQLEKDPKILIGMDKPTEGIWKHIVYYWKLWWNCIFKILGNLYLIFFPLIIIYKIIKGYNTSQPYKNFFKSFMWYLLYLSITNTIIFIHGILKGNIMVEIPQGMTTWMEYLFLLKNILPFHGLYHLTIYTIQLILRT